MTTAQHDTQARIVADDKVPAIHIYREFSATPAQLIKAHTDPELYARWAGPDGSQIKIQHWDARDGGSWNWDDVSGDEPQSFRGCFHTVGDDRIVQTFTWEGMPDTVSLETLTFTDLGDGRTELHAVSLCDSFEARDGWLASGMEIGVDQGYAKLDGLVTEL